MPDAQGELPVPRHIKVLEPGVEPTKVYIKPEAKIPNIQEAILTAGQSGIEGDVVKGQILKKVTRVGKKEYEAYPANPGEEVDWNSVAGLRISLHDGVILNIDKKHLSLDPLKNEKSDSAMKPAQKQATPFTPPEKVSASLVSVFGDIRKNEDIEVAEARLEAEERMQLGKGELRGGTFGERMKSWGTMLWKHNFWETAYKSRERIFSLLVHEQADLPTHVTREIFQKAEETARKRLDDQTKTLSEREQRKIKRKRGWDEAEGFFTDVHNETLKVFKEWREELGKLADSNLSPTERNRIINYNPLYEERLAWMQVSQEMADNIGNEILHADRGEAQFAEKLLIGKDTAIGKKILDDIAKPLWQGMLAGGDRDALRLQAQEKLTTLFASDEFTSLLSTLPPEKQALLKSRNYGTTLIETFEKIGKQVEAMTDHQASIDRLHFDIELTLGVAEWGPRNKIETTVTEKRAKKNQELYNKLRNREPIWGNSADLEYASKRAIFLSDAAQDLLRNEVLWGTAVPALLYLPMRTFTSGIARFIVPVVGGSLVSGFIGGRKEYQRLAKERQVMNLEEALGQSFPLTMEIAKRKYGFFGEVQKQEKTTRRGELFQYSYHKRSMGEAISTLDELLGPEGQIEESPAQYNEEQVKKLYATVIDLEARNAISDQRNINLLSNQLPDESMAPESFEIQKRRLDKLLSRARVNILHQIEFAQNDPQAPAELKQFITDLSGPPGPKNPADLMGELVMLQVNALRGEIGLGDARYRMALGELTVKEGQSLAARDMLFEKFRKWKAVKRGTQTAVVGAIIGASIQEATNDVLHLIQTGHLEGVGPISGALHWIEGKGAAGPISAPEFTQPAHSYGDGNIQMSDNMRIDENGNLDILNPNSTWQEDVIKGFSSHLKFNPNGTLDHASLAYLQQQEAALGLHFTNTVDASTAFQAHIDPKDTYDMVINNQHVTVPSALRFIDDPANPAGTKDLILSMNALDGRQLDILIANNIAVDPNGMPVDQTAFLDILKHNSFLNFHDGQLQFLGNNLPGSPDALPNGIAQVPLPDGTIEEVHALIPQGTHLISDGHGAYDLIDSNNQVLLHSVGFDPDGHIANAADPVLQQEAMANHISLGGHPEQVTAPGTISGDFPKQVSDMGGTHGARGPWGWLEEPIQDPAVGINHDLPATNLLKNLFRGWTENQNLHPGTTYDTNYTSLQGSYIYEKLPNALFENGQIVKIGQLMDEAINKFEGGGVDYHTFAPSTDHDKLLLLAYELGRVGRVPGEVEMKFFLEQMGGTTQTVTYFQPEILMKASQHLPSTVDLARSDFLVNMISIANEASTPPVSFIIPPFTIIPLMGRKPLEQAISNPESKPLKLAPNEQLPIVLPEIPDKNLKPEGGYEVLPPEVQEQGVLHWLQEWLSQRPERLHTYIKNMNADGSLSWQDKDGMPVSRSVERERAEIQRYLQMIKDTNPDYHSSLEKSLAVQTLKPMHETTKVSVNIPAWMEGNNIYRTLESYVKQTDANGNPIDPDLYEINILVNRKRGDIQDNTVTEIERFILKNAEKGNTFHINYLDVEFDPPFNNVGHARKVITDITLMRSLARQNQSHPLYLESEDADLMIVDSHTIANLIEKLDNNPHLDSVVGRQERLPEIMMQNDYLFLDRRLWDLGGALLRKRRYNDETQPHWDNQYNKLATGGWNTAYTAEIYAIIDGGDSNRVMGEDTVIGDKIAIIRGDGQRMNVDTVDTVPTISHSSPRRFIMSIIDSLGAYSDAFTDEKLNEYIKTAPIEELMGKISDVARINPENEHMFKDKLAWWYDWLKSKTPTIEDARREYETLMMWIGLEERDFEFTQDDKVIIKSIESLRASLEEQRRIYKVAPKTWQNTMQTDTKAPLKPVDDMAANEPANDKAVPVEDETLEKTESVAGDTSEIETLTPIEALEDRAVANADGETISQPSASPTSATSDTS